MIASLNSESLSVLINSFGAEIKSITNKHGLEFIWQADKSVWARRAPVLFPIVGKLKEDKFIFNNDVYQLPQHGFARDMEFDLISENMNSCVFKLASNNETRKKFPFDFIFLIKYELTGNILNISYSIKNPSKELIYFSIGAHPGFNCPLLPGETFEDYYLEFEKNNYTLTELSDGLLTNTTKTLKLTNNKLFISASLFNNDALIFENNQINSVSLCSKKSSHKITLNCKDWPFFGIWSKKNNAPFICLEPWFGIADTVNSNQQLISKKGIISLQGASEFNCSYSLAFF